MEGYTLVSHNYARGFDFDQIDKKKSNTKQIWNAKKKNKKKVGKILKKFLIV